jgi:hypothetical protein
LVEPLEEAIFNSTNIINEEYFRQNFDRITAQLINLQTFIIVSLLDDL